MKLYGDISKTEQQDDGTIKVYGYASTECVDSIGEVVTAEAMKAAIPNYMKFGAVREMHDAKKAAGTAIEIEVQEDGRTFFGAHVVDSEAVKKVSAGVYKGFSIGGKVTERDELKKNIITGVDLREISLVDRPANGEAVFTMFKSDNNEQIADDLKKYMGESIWDVSMAIDALSTIMYLLEKEMMERENNADQVASLKAVIENIKAFIVSEIQEPDESMKAAQNEGFEKAGKQISSTNMEKIQAIHDHAVSLGAVCGEASKGAATDDLQKLDDLQKQFDSAKVEIDDLKKALTTAKDEIEKLKAEPEPPRAAINDHGVVVSKAEDNGGEIDALVKQSIVHNSKGEVDVAASLIKAAHIIKR